SVTTQHEGRGVFSFTPRPGESYSLHITKPAGISKLFPLPAPKTEGLSLVSNQLIGEPGDKVKLTLASTSAGSYTVVFSKHETEVASTIAKLEARDPSTIELTPPAWADGVLVATVKDQTGKSIAERLVFRKPAKSLHVTVAA